MLHAARQPPRGRWTRKLGELEAIDPARRGLEGKACGSVAIIRSRLVAGGPGDAASRAARCVSVNGPESLRARIPTSSPMWCAPFPFATIRGGGAFQ